VNLNVVLPLCSSVLSFIFFAFLIDQWRERRRTYQLVWAIGMVWYGLSAGTEFLGGAFGWSEPLYRTWYLIGAIFVAGWLGLGTSLLLARTRFGLALVPVFLLLALISIGGARLYPDVGIASPIYAVVSLVLAVSVGWLAFRRDERWATIVAIGVVGGSIAATALTLTVSLPSPGWVVDAKTHIPTGQLFPGYLRLLTPLFNVTGAFALSFGALFSAYIFMPKRRLIRYSLDRHQPIGPATILIAIGGIIPAITSGLNRFGDTSGFFVGELLGVVFLFAGFVVSVEVFSEIRIPFTHVVLRARQAEQATQGAG
jgi:hypothetical protein